MKNCLSVITAVAWLVEGELTPRGRQRLERLEAATERLRGLVADDLDEKPAAEDDRCPTRRMTYVDALVRDVAARLADRAEHADVHLATECGGGRIVGDESDLKEALFNVVANAVEATPPGGQVTIRTEVTVEADHVWVVKDTGCGIPSHQLPMLGRPFATGRPGGSGLGLAFARKVVAEHGGLVHVESTVGLGTTVSLWLPSASP